ncbi:ubiquitin-like protein 7 [Amphiura filiformis]|uniref:ubiquitin-like protein 7 n=1 Tax=Amphiura filiformis TaxID=82378 RepID=UPI003B21E911
MASKENVVCVKFPEKAGRSRLHGVNFSTSVSDFKQQVSEAIGVQPSELLLLYCGRKLQDAEPLNSYGLQGGCTVHALRKKQPEPEPKPEPLDDQAIRQLITAFHAALLNPAHRQTVRKILTSHETIDNIIAATPGISSDHIAVSMLRDPELLIQIADPENVHKIVKAHPTIGHAVMQIAASVNEEGARAGAAGSSGGAEGRYLPDFMSDDEMDTSEGGVRRGQQAITATQLASALAAAGVGSGGTFRPYDSPVVGASSNPSTSSPAQASTSGSSNSGSNNGSGLITSDLFGQAMAQALQVATGGSVSGGSSPARSSQQQGGEALNPENLQAQLQQLRDMGITDDARSLRALQVTAGNVQAALELIFEDRI